MDEIRLKTMPQLEHIEAIEKRLWTAAGHPARELQLRQ
jgi:hypothetical protein